MLFRAMEISQGTAQELMPQEKCNCRNIDTFVQQLHGKGMPEAVEGDMLVDTGRDVAFGGERGVCPFLGAYFPVGLETPDQNGDSWRNLYDSLCAERISSSRKQYILLTS